MPKRSDPFTGAAGPGLAVMLAIAVTLGVVSPGQATHD
jgi:hypothetical protein